MNGSLALVSLRPITSKGSITAEFMREEISMAAHDLRNPLACVVSTLELLDAKAEKALKAEICTVVRRGLRAADRMERMIQRLLHNARYPVAQIIDVAECDLISLVGSAVENNLLAATKKNISINLSGAKVGIKTDEHFLIEAIDNLISNAVKYSSPGSAISCKIELDERSILIHIIDQGPGLSPQDLTNLGNPFQKLSAKPTAGETSTGLGLWSTRRIADALGGTLQAKNNGVNAGSTFTLSLPR